MNNLLITIKIRKENTLNLENKTIVLYDYIG